MRFDPSEIMTDERNGRKTNKWEEEEKKTEEKQKQYDRIKDAEKV
jgi:hypothetical protein